VIRFRHEVAEIAGNRAVHLPCHRRVVDAAEDPGRPRTATVLGLDAATMPLAVSRPSTCLSNSPARRMAPSRDLMERITLRSGPRRMPSADSGRVTGAFNLGSGTRGASEGPRSAAVWLTSGLER
jgi:hypothetical protein